MTRHAITWAPIRLSRHLAEVLAAAGDTAKVNADVMRARVIVLVDAVAVARVAGEGGACLWAWLETVAVKIEIGRSWPSIAEEE